MIAIIDYGMGNLHSVSKAVERLGFEYRVTSSAEEINGAERVILPGVGAFGDAMKQLRKSGLERVINDIVQEGTPLLGICLGMQLLFTTSEEGGQHEGLGLLSGHARRFTGVDERTGQAYKVPHMGWNKLQLKQKHHPVLAGIDQGYTYFVHSFYMDQMKEKEIIAYADYHIQVPGIVGREHIVGMQFHPEKSGQTGMQLLKNFLLNVKSARRERV